MTQDEHSLTNMLRALTSAVNSVDDQLKKIQKELKVVTVVFFDLVGSTRFRRVHGAIKGLQKAERHNLLVSAAVLENDGEIVKWLGDGVMAMFRGVENGKDHPIRALHAALDAINRVNKGNAGKVNWEDAIHTKIGMSTGNVFVWTVQAEDPRSATRPLTDSDPMGSAVDLAARLESLAMPDTVLIDRYTFWGDEFDDIKPQTTPICVTPLSELISPRNNRAVTESVSADGWRELLLNEERNTTYLPKAAPFLVRENGLQLLKVAGAATPIVPSDFSTKAHEVAQRDEATKNSQFVFACEPVGCNIKGFRERVEAIAVSFAPQEKPVKQIAYDFPSRVEIEKLLEDADGFHKLGDKDEAKKKYEEVIRLDRRDFRANVRMAQYLRWEKQPEKASRHWDEAKQSNPNNPMIWALAATSHLEIYIENRSFPDERSFYSQNALERHQDRSITGFTRARKMAIEQFDSSLEQHCSCFLVICHSLRRHKDDLLKAENLVRELDSWLPQTVHLNLLHEIAKAFFYIAVEGRRFDAAGDALGTAEKILKSLGKQPSMSATTLPDTMYRQDALMEKQDFNLLWQFAKLRLDIAQRRNTFDTPIDAAGKSK